MQYEGELDLEGFFFLINDAEKKKNLRLMPKGKMSEGFFAGGSINDFQMNFVRNKRDELTVCGFAAAVIKFILGEISRIVFFLLTPGQMNGMTNRAFHCDRCGIALFRYFGVKFFRNMMQCFRIFQCNQRGNANVMISTNMGGYP